MAADTKNQTSLKMNKRAIDTIDEIIFELLRNKSNSSNSMYVDWDGALYPWFNWKRKNQWWW
jgi:hypothetical protein